MAGKIEWKEVKPGVFESELGVVHPDQSQTRWFGIRKDSVMGQTGFRETPEGAMRELEAWIEREKCARRCVSG